MPDVSSERWKESKIRCSWRWHFVTTRKATALCTLNEHRAHKRFQTQHADDGSRVWSRIQGTMSQIRKEEAALKHLGIVKGHAASEKMLVTYKWSLAEHFHAMWWKGRKFAGLSTKKEEVDTIQLRKEEKKTAMKKNKEMSQWSEAVCSRLFS